MAHNLDARARVHVAVAVAGFVVAVAAMLFYLQNGGAQLRRDAARRIEECDAVLAGSSTIGLRLAPALVSDFLKQGGYEVSAPQGGREDGVLVVGRRGDLACTVRIRSSEPADGFKDAMSGRAHVVMSTRPVLPQDVGGSGPGDASPFSEHLFAYDAMAMVVHASNPLRQMSLDDAGLVAIGVTSNWADAGGKSAPVHLYASLENAGADDLPNDLVPSKDVKWVTARDRPGVVVLRDDPAVLERLASDPIGVGFLSAAYPRDPARLRDVQIAAGGPAAAPTAAAVRAQAYPMARRLFFYVRSDAQQAGFAQRFVAFSASAGAFDRIDALGFVAVRPSSAAASGDVRALGCRIGAPESATLSRALAGARREATVLRFREGTVDLDDAARADVARLAQTMSAQVARGDRVMLVGHSDIEGLVERNRELGLKRALAARAAFETRGVYGLQVESAGEVCPLEDTETDAGRRANRRVEIWIRAANP